MVNTICILTYLVDVLCLNANTRLQCTICNDVCGQEFSRCCVVLSPWRRSPLAVNDTLHHVLVPSPGSHYAPGTHHLPASADGAQWYHTSTNPPVNTTLLLSTSFIFHKYHHDDATSCEHHCALSPSCIMPHGMARPTSSPAPPSPYSSAHVHTASQIPTTTNDGDRPAT